VSRDAYALGGEGLRADVAVCADDLGLSLAERAAGGAEVVGAFGLPVAAAAGAGGGTAVVLWADGDAVEEDAAGGWCSEPKVDRSLSWGAGEGAIATAVLMIEGECVAHDGLVGRRMRKGRDGNRSQS